MARSGRTIVLGILLIVGAHALAGRALTSAYRIEVAAAGQSARVLLRAVSAPRRTVPEADIRGYAAPYYSLRSRHAFKTEPLPLGGLKRRT